MHLSSKGRRVKDAKKIRKKIRLQTVSHIAKHLGQVHNMALRLLNLSGIESYTNDYDMVVRRNMKHYRPRVEFDT